ncbi:mitotic spindle assembly checkpoint protein MAD2A [Schistocerca cancellata]|uniref:mitotic spindle assembly checkpoint protein MAD2A n=1 Tax=Schistocerca cancellata TaxID=274614 RepID=UPI002117B20B|nr:mitotic spindle assembly checkpoint protein MAD2A [Schistocerca cancellata]
MTEAAVKNTNCITLKGSAKLVAEYLNYGINSILYQRGIYPSETFSSAEYFGVTILMSQDEKVKDFLKEVLGQAQEWLLNKKVEKIALTITDVDTKEIMERWDFKVQYENSSSCDNPDKEIGNKDLQVIQREIRDVLRQIAASISYLPLLDCICSFDVLIYTTADCEVPEKWNETEPAFITNSQEVKLRTFSTSLHRVDTLVSYKAST